MRAPRIDVADLRHALRGGETLAAYAKRSGFSIAGLRDALGRAGIRVPRRRPATVPLLYSLWRSIRSRCERKRDPAYRRYGALGSRVCAAWQAFPAFQEWALASGWKPGRAIVLRNRQLGYRPSNCTWGTRAEAAKVGLTAFGETKSVQAWARDRRAKVTAQTIRDRVRDGVPPEEAITARVARHGKRGKGRPHRTIEWDRVRELRDLTPAAIARRLRRSETAIRVGMRSRGWEKPVVRIRELEHGTLLYRVWNSTLRRQEGHGWPTFAAFHAWALRSGYEPGLFLTRPDRTKPASPRNARWLPVRESWQYRRPLTVCHKTTRPIRAFGESKSAAAWARDPRCVVTAAGLLSRLDRGMKPKDAITKRKRREADYSSSKQLEAWGVTKPIAAWARDRRAKVGAGAIRKRLRQGWKAEQAIATSAFGRRPR